MSDNNSVILEKRGQAFWITIIRPGKIHRKGRTAVLQIGAGTKRLVARAGQHDDTDFLVVMRVAIASGDA